MSTYATPGVYISEIPTPTPPTTTTLATAVPAFIGLTEKAINNKGESLANTPTRISNLDEYETLFGKGNLEPFIVEVTNIIKNTSEITVRSKISMNDFIFYDDHGIKKPIPYNATFSFQEDPSSSNIKATFNGKTVHVLDNNSIDVTFYNSENLFNISEHITSENINFTVSIKTIDIASEKIFYRDSSGTVIHIPENATFSLDSSNNILATFDSLTETVVDSDGNPITKNRNHFDVKINTGNHTEVFSYFNLYDLVRSTNEVKLAEQNPAGGSKSKHFMHASLQLYFANGGGPCYIISVGDYNTQSTDLEGKLTNGLNKLEEEDEPTLIVFPDIYALDGNLSIYQKALTQCNKLQDRFVIMDVATTGNPRTDAATFRNNISSNYLKYGAAYYPDLISSLPYNYDLEATHNSIIQIFKKENGELIDTLSNGIKNDDQFFGLTSIGGIRSKNQSIYNDIVEKISKYTMTVPSSGAISGVYFQVDINRGVWKAPANVALNSVTAPKITVTDSLQENLNIDAISGKSINAIRSFTGKGTLVWGARTLDGNDNDWRYIQVRRFFNYVEESIQKSTSWAVFEGNTTATWTRVKVQIENFLTGIWKQGGLAGGSTAEAFFVNVGEGITMYKQDILEGRMNVEIGLAAVRPAEFIILKFSHFIQQS